MRQGLFLVVIATLLSDKYSKGVFVCVFAGEDLVIEFCWL